MTGPPAARPILTSAEGPAPQTVPDVWLRDHSGDGARRIPRALANRLVLGGVADQVSAAGHVRLKLGIRFLPNGDTIHGLPAVERSRYYRGDAVTARDMRHLDRRAL